jgi:hypothetical protein
VLKGLVRFVLVWGLAVALAPYVGRLFDQLARKAPEGSLLEDTLYEFGDRHSSGLVRAFGDAIGDLVLGSK